MPVSYLSVFFVFVELHCKSSEAYLLAGCYI